MEFVKLQISLDFIQSRTHMSWRDVLFGMNNELFSPKEATQLAAQQLGERSAPDPALVDLAILSDDESGLQYVQQLAAAEPEEDSDKIQQKWLYLVLAWILEHKDNYSDPLGAVEAVYADFGYPKVISQFVRYMPMLDADLGSKQANEGRLYDKWKSFIEDASVYYRRS